MLLYRLTEAAEADLNDRLNTAGVAYCDKNATTYLLLALPYSEARIKPSPSGFGEYQLVPGSGERWANEDDLVDAMRGSLSDVGAKLVELGVDVLPDRVEDIRGRVANEPKRIFALLDEEDDLIGYTNIIAD